MRAVTRDRYGGPEVLRLEEVPRPEPGDGEVLVRVHAAGLNAGDRHVLRGEPFVVRIMVSGLMRPKQAILGSDLAGTVEAVKPGVTRFRPGDAVFGTLSESGFGSFAEFAVAPETALVRKPEAVSFQAAAATPVSGNTALQALRDHGHLQAGQRVLVNGASGGVGHFAVQIARSMGAEVTGVCSTRNVEMVRSLGAARVIDYTKDDYTRLGDTWDLIVDTAAHAPFSDCKRALAPGGTYVLVGGPVAQMFKLMAVGPWLSRGGERRLTTMLEKPNPDDLALLADLLASGSIQPFIGRRYPLEELPTAIADLEGGRARGKLVIEM